MANCTFCHAPTIYFSNISSNFDKEAKLEMDRKTLHIRNGKRARDRSRQDNHGNTIHLIR